ncbi:unnamed protein product [Moneuplotes crassus]|uniref:Uncharacterized protein n=1 Tax=Euplotes crassus TaxID=5936 RepID=A0AAD1XRI9_EUPCR|nr:unnamed protein product [Moneuplotes crassus]
MRQTNTNLKGMRKGRKENRKYVLWRVACRELCQIDFLDFFYFRLTDEWVKTYYVSFPLSTEGQKQTLKKMAKLNPQFHRLSFIDLPSIKQRKTRIYYMNYCTKVLSQMKGSCLGDLIIGESCKVLDNFSFYARSVLRLAPRAVRLIQIENFKISHKHFGRILMSCDNTETLCLSGCQVNVDNLDYLNHVRDTKDARPSIKHINLEFNTFIQPVEDNENLDGLMQKIAESRLDTYLLTVKICLRIRRMTVNKHLLKEEYKVGNFNVTISYLPLFA